MASVAASGPDVDDNRAGYVDGNALARPPSEVGALVSQRPQREGRAGRVGDRAHHARKLGRGAQALDFKVRGGGCPNARRNYTLEG